LAFRQRDEADAAAAAAAASAEVGLADHDARSPLAAGKDVAGTQSHSSPSNNEASSAQQHAQSCNDSASRTLAKETSAPSESTSQSNASIHSDTRVTESSEATSQRDPNPSNSNSSSNGEDNGSSGALSLSQLSTTTSPTSAERQQHGSPTNDSVPPSPLSSVTSSSSSRGHNQRTRESDSPSSPPFRAWPASGGHQGSRTNRSSNERSYFGGSADNVDRRAVSPPRPRERSRAPIWQHVSPFVTTSSCASNHSSPRRSVAPTPEGTNQTHSRATLEQLRAKVDSQRDAMSRLVAELSSTKRQLAAEQERAIGLASRVATSTRKRLDEDYRLIIRTMVDAHRKEVTNLESEIEVLRINHPVMTSTSSPTAAVGRRPSSALSLRSGRRVQVRGAVNAKREFRKPSGQVPVSSTLSTSHGPSGTTKGPRRSRATYVNMFEEARHGPEIDYNNTDNNQIVSDEGTPPALRGQTGLITRALFEWVSLHGSRAREVANQSRVRRFLLGAGLVPQSFTLGQVDIILTKRGGRGGLSLMDFADVLEELSQTLAKEGALSMMRKTTRTGGGGNQHALTALYGLPRPATRMHPPMRSHLEQNAPRVWTSVCAACGSGPGDNKPVRNASRGMHHK
jgi:hypothetical protein